MSSPTHRYASKTWNGSPHVRSPDATRSDGRNATPDAPPDGRNETSTPTKHQAHGTILYIIVMLLHVNNIIIIRTNVLVEFIIIFIIRI